MLKTKCTKRSWEQSEWNLIKNHRFTIAITYWILSKQQCSLPHWHVGISFHASTSLLHFIPITAYSNNTCNTNKRILVLKRTVVRQIRMPQHTQDAFWQQHLTCALFDSLSLANWFDKNAWLIRTHNSTRITKNRHRSITDWQSAPESNLTSLIDEQARQDGAIHKTHHNIIQVKPAVKSGNRKWTLNNSTK